MSAGDHRGQRPCPRDTAAPDPLQNRTRTCGAHTGISLAHHGGKLLDNGIHVTLSSVPFEVPVRAVVGEDRGWCPIALPALVDARTTEGVPTLSVNGISHVTQANGQVASASSSAREAAKVTVQGGFLS